MKICPINNVSFGYKHKVNKKDLKTVSESKPKTLQDTNEYFLAVDSVTKALPKFENGWDELYSLNLNQKLALTNIFKLTYKTQDKENPYPHSLFLNPSAKPVESVVKLVKTDDILSKEERQKFYDKTKGAFKYDTLEKYKDAHLEDTQEAKDNLNFIKILMQDENKDIFEEMSPATLVGILYNRFLTYDDFSESLEIVREDNVMGYPKNEIRETLHNYFLGESLYKIIDVEDFDEVNELK